MTLAAPTPVPAADNPLGVYDTVVDVKDMKEQDLKEVLALLLERLNVRIVCNQTAAYKSFRLVPVWTSS